MPILNQPYPHYISFLPVPIPSENQPHSTKNDGIIRRFQLRESPPIQLFKGFEKQEHLWIPSHLFEASDNWSKKGADQIKMILKTTVIHRGSCWLWVGAKTGGMPTVRYLGKACHALKVLISWIIKDHPSGISLYRRCSSDFCINPAHFHISPKEFNYPIDPMIINPLHQKSPEDIFWITGERLPWMHLKMGMFALEREELMSGEAAQQQAMAPKEGQSFRDFFKITTSGQSGEAANHAENGMQENS